VKLTVARRYLGRIRVMLQGGLWLCLGLSLLVAYVVCDAIDGTPPSSSSSLQMRGVWVQARSISSPQAVDAMLERAVAGNFNTLFVNVFTKGKAYYNSQVAERANSLPSDFDPLAYLVPRAHERGLQVHAWLPVGRVGWPTLTLEPWPVLSQHPEWGMVNACGIPGNWLNLARPDARRFIQDVVMEVAQQYSVDGIHLDYLRYPGPGWSFDDYSAAAFAQTYGADLAALRQFELPARARFSGNPLLLPSTASVLATFDTGEPALLLNAYGDGEVVLFNWDVIGCQVGAAGEMMRRGLQRLASEGSAVYLFRPDAADEANFYNAQAWLRSLGWEPLIVDEEDMVSLLADGVLVLPNVYRIAPSLAQALADFVRQGGGLIFLDGPTPSISDANVQAITGMQDSGRHFFREERWLQPSGDHPLLPVGTPTWDENLARQWDEFRKESVSRLVQEVRQEMVAQESELALSAAVFSSRAQADVVGQDWEGWLDTGALDFAVPMAYVDDPTELNPLLVEWQTLSHFERVVPGLIVYVERTESSKSPQQVLDEIALIRAEGARGVVLFDMEHIDEALLEALASGPFAPESRAAP
jgi:uncharacterized lipoprotein YddW (UPF0748 family)